MKAGFATAKSSVGGPTQTRSDRVDVQSPEQHKVTLENGCRRKRPYICVLNQSLKHYSIHLNIMLE